MNTTTEGTSAIVQDRARWSRHRHRFAQELERLPIPREGSDATPLHEGDLAALPEPARRYLRVMGALDRPKDWSLCAHWRGRFRRGPDEAWRAVEAWQYNSALEVARVFHMHFPMGGVLPVYVRDTYLSGHGRMLGRVLDLVPVVDATGDALDQGELVTWLNDAVLLAPSMLLRPEVTWSPLDERSFELALTDAGHTVRARVFLDALGRPCDFSTTDRFVEDPFTAKHPLVRARWSTPVEGFETVEGRCVPRRGKAVWHLPQREFAYADLELASISWNVTPGR